MTVDVTALDNPVWAALTGPHARFADVHGRAARYRPEVGIFAALADDTDPHAWNDLAALLGPAGQVAVTGPMLDPPDGWTVLGRDGGVQLVDVSVEPADHPDVVELDTADVPEMLALVAAAKPGPFLPRTIELGTYLGIRRGGALVAMAGERLRLPGWTEISAVCTDPAFRGQGLASRLVLAVAAGVRRRGDTPMMHAAATNTSAIRLYESLGFRVRRQTRFALVEAPGP
jgi:ribosomal protein S18 acetylase RimI-like enzyme